MLWKFCSGRSKFGVNFFGGTLGLVCFFISQDIKRKTCTLLLLRFHSIQVHITSGISVFFVFMLNEQSPCQQKPYLQFLAVLVFNVATIAISPQVTDHHWWPLRCTPLVYLEGPVHGRLGDSFHGTWQNRVESMCILYVLSHSIDMYAACIYSAISLIIELQS